MSKLTGDDWKYQLSKKPCDRELLGTERMPIDNACPSCNHEGMMIDTAVNAHAECRECGDVFCVRRYTWT